MATIKRKKSIEEALAEAYKNVGANLLANQPQRLADTDVSAAFSQLTTGKQLTTSPLGGFTLPIREWNAGVLRNLRRHVTR